MNTEKLRTIIEPYKPVIKAMLVIAGVFIFLFIGKYLLNIGAEFVKAARGFSQAFA